VGHSFLLSYREAGRVWGSYKAGPPLSSRMREGCETLFAAIVPPAGLELQPGVHDFLGIPPLPREAQTTEK